MLAEFLDDLRESKPWYKVKAVVLGKKVQCLSLFFL